MSAILNLKIASEAEISELLDEPEQIASYLEGDEPSSEEHGGDLDTTWAALHYLFTGSADGGEPPASYLLRGGQPMGSMEYGYDVPRFLSPAEVRQFSAFLGTLDEQTLQNRYDPRRMNELDIYPGGWKEVEQQEVLPETQLEPFQYLLENYRRLKGLVGKAAEQGNGMILWLS